MLQMVISNTRQPWTEAPAEKILQLKLLGSSRKPPVLAKTRGQIDYLKAMRENEVVFGIGPAGTGKTYLAMAQALQSLRDKTVQRLVLTRPAVEAGEALGFLPGDLNEKVFPYLRPLYDALYEMLETDEAEKMIERGIVEIAPLAYMRGRTLKNSFVILDEAQNTTTEQMLMFLTRLGEGSRCVVTGDPSQVDLKRGVRSGLAEAMHILSGVEGLSFIRFEPTDVVRLPIVQRIIEAYRIHRGTGE
ncbi:PhoH family protein [Verrucomicrobium spinosum]|nr:PhoH family protein [Verrucomicrobium spinosum]